VTKRLALGALAARSRIMCKHLKEESDLDVRASSCFSLPRIVAAAPASAHDVAELQTVPRHLTVT